MSSWCLVGQKRRGNSGKREQMIMKLKVFVNLLLVFLFFFWFMVPCVAQTDPRDVEVIGRLYESLGHPPLHGWSAAGDPCLEGWQGVSCVFSNITALDLGGQNLEGSLGDSLAFPSILSIDLSNNRINGSIPFNLPSTVVNLSLSNNSLSGGIPDSFQQLGVLTHLDLSNNNLSSQLPSSFGNLSALTALYLQNNHFIGTLDVLPDLHLVELNVENNQFSGPIPEKLFTIPNFRKDGNPFNTTVIPSPSPSPAPVPSPAEAPYFIGAPLIDGDGPFGAPEAQKAPKSQKLLTRKIILWIVGLGVLAVIIVAFGLLLYFSRCFRGQQANRLDERHDLDSFKGQKVDPKYNEHLLQPDTREKAQTEAVVNSFATYGVDNKNVGLPPRLWDDGKRDEKSRSVFSSHNKSRDDSPPPPPSSRSPVEQAIIDPAVPAKTSTRVPSKIMKSPHCGNVFSVASLQQYTDSFSHNNLIGKDMLGSVYRAELPDGKLLAVKYLDAAISKQLDDGKFLELVSSISRLQHDNIAELVGYCFEHGQWLLVYSYCSNGTLYDALHMKGDIHEKLSWNLRINVALGAARALEYLHEGCQPPLAHTNFKSANVLLDDELIAHVSHCGLAPLFSSVLAQQMAGHTACAYDAPEIQSDTVTCQSDVYSFGVVMLELLTAQRSYDRSRPRGEQSIVRWAIPQLHDIDALSKMVDPSLKGQYTMKSLSRFADIISLCIQQEPEFRPPMSEIVQELMQLVKQDPRDRIRDH